MRRRTFLAGAAAACGAGGLDAFGAKIKLGVTDWNLRLAGKLEAIALASRLEFEGVQVSIGRKAENGKMPLDDSELIGKYVTEAKARKVAINSTCLDILHVNGLKNDRLGEKWVSDGIRVTKAIGTRVMLLPFFGKCALETRDEMDFVGDVLKNLAPEAEKAKVILGLENTISAADNLRMMERAKSPAVRVYYDVGNSTKGGFDIIREMEQLGARRICQMHFKDNPHYLGEGTIDFKAVLHKVNDIGYRDWVNLETDSPSKLVEADMRRNLTYIRRLMVS
jgi:sugar phosphate isomerase/epimerase